MIPNKTDIPACDPPLADTLRLMLPPSPLNLLLQAAILDGDRVAEAWSNWRGGIGDPKAFLASDRVGIKRHLPLLYDNLTANRVSVGRDLEPYFRAARAREELRSVRFRKFLGEALGALRRDGIEFLAGKGITVGELVHPDPVLRHSHDIDLLVDKQDLPAAADALRRAGFSPGASPESGDPQFIHASGLPVELHDRLYRTPFYRGALDGVWGRAREDSILDTPVRALSDVDLLVQAPVHASLVRQRANLSWILDVLSLLRKRGSEGAAIDWPLVAEVAGETRAQLPLFVMYHYLAETFQAPIPDDLIQALRRSASGAGRLQRLVAIDGLRAGSNTGFRALLRASDRASRRAIVTAMIAPPLAYLKTKQPEISSMPPALLYLTRPMRAIGRQIKTIGQRRGRTRPDPDGDEARRAFLARLLPEERLLLDCIQRELSPEAARRIVADMQDRAIDWTLLLETAGRNGVEPLLATNLKKCREQGLTIPVEVSTKLRRAMFVAMETKERQVRQLKDVLEFTNRNRLTVMLIKGAALDAVVLQMPWHVVSLDIDLLIREPAEDLPRPVCEHIWDFNGHGPFECDFAEHHDLSIDGLLSIDYPGIWRDARKVNVQGEEVHVMCPEDMLIATCITGCRKRFFQLKILYSLREILDSCDDLDWDRVARKAESYRCRAIVYAALYAARLAVDARVSDTSLRLLKVGPVQAAMIRFLAGRRSFTPFTGRQAMNPKHYTLYTKTIFSRGNLSVILPYTAYTWRQRLARLRWLSQTEAMSKPGLFLEETAAAESSAEKSRDPEEFVNVMGR